MNPFLKMLMGQQTTGMPGIIPGYGGGTFNADGSTATTEEEGNIPVNMDRVPRFSSEDNPNADPVFLGNTGNVEATEQAIRKGQEASDRRGLFGVKGTLRDVLGLVGDSFLIQSGNNPMYAPRRRQEKISDAMAGFTEDPVSAAERVGYYDPKMGQDLIEQAKNDELRAAQLESLSASRQDLADMRKAQRYDKARPALTALFNQGGAYLPDGSINPAAIQMARTIAKKYGFELEDFVNDNMTAEEAQLFAGSGIKTVDQERLEDADQNIDIANRNADSRSISARASMIRAQRPPAGRAAPNPTEASEFARIRGKLNRGETLSPGDKATWEKYTAPPARGRGRGGREAPKPSVSNW